mgnify:CR=1 FL=1
MTMTMTLSFQSPSAFIVGHIIFWHLFFYFFLLYCISLFLCRCILFYSLTVFVLQVLNMQSGSITLEPDIDKIPRRPHTKTYTYGELRTATTGLEITHMYIIKGDIPPSLENIAPHLQNFRLSYMKTDQLERWERNLIMFSMHVCTFGLRRKESLTRPSAVELYLSAP